MKKGWETKKLGELIDVQNGYAFSSKDYSESGHFVMRIGNVQNGYISTSDAKFIKLPADGSLQKFVLTENDILVSLTGNVGRVGVIQKEQLPAAINQRVARITVRKGSPATRQLLLFFLFSDWFREELTGAGHGAAQQNVSTKDLVAIEIPVPPLAEQQRIVAVLDAAFENITIAQTNAEQNLKNARALFESHLQAVFTQSGEGYVEKKLSDVCAITSVLIDPRKEECLNLTHVGAANIKSQTGMFIDLKTAQDEGLISGKFLFDETMVLYSKIRPYLMKVARPEFNGLCSADMYPLSPTSNEITRDYLFHLLLSKGFTDYAIQGSARAGMPKVNREHMFEFKCWLPDVKRQKKIASNLDKIHGETQRLESIYQQKLTSLAELKKSLLHQAFSGQL